MMNQENQNLVAAYSVTIILAVLLIILLINFNRWFFPDTVSEPAQFTPASRGLVGQDDLKLGLFNDSKFRSLGPLLTAEELKRLEEEERTETGTVTEPGEVTGTVKPPVIKREVRHSNPFLPF